MGASRDAVYIPCYPSGAMYGVEPFSCQEETQEEDFTPDSSLSEETDDENFISNSSVEEIEEDEEEEFIPDSSPEEAEVEDFNPVSSPEETEEEDFNPDSSPEEDEEEDFNPDSCPEEAEEDDFNPDSSPEEDEEKDFNPDSSPEEAEEEDFNPDSSPEEAEEEDFNPDCSFEVARGKKLTPVSSDAEDLYSRKMSNPGFEESSTQLINSIWQECKSRSPFSAGVASSQVFSITALNESDGHQLELPKGEPSSENQHLEPPSEKSCDEPHSKSSCQRSVSGTPKKSNHDGTYDLKSNYSAEIASSQSFSVTALNDSDGHQLGWPSGKPSSKNQHLEPPSEKSCDEPLSKRACQRSVSGTPKKSNHDGTYDLKSNEEKSQGGSQDSAGDSDQVPSKSPKPGRSASTSRKMT